MVDLGVLTHIDPPQGVPDESPFPHVIQLVADLQTPDASHKPSLRSSSFTDTRQVCVTTQVEILAEIDLGELALHKTQSNSVEIRKLNYNISDAKTLLELFDIKSSH